VQKISPPLGLDPRTIHHVASHQTDYITQPTEIVLLSAKSSTP